MTNKSAEHQRLAAYRDKSSNWKHWGPYLSERAWGTVREDYSAHGSAWEHHSHDHARSRAYRWNEDGLAGISDRNQYLCFALALWNGRDAILKERLFGLTGNEGNHGEDVKEVYYYLDSTPTHSYMKMLYKYPQRAFPYEQLVRENQRRGFEDFEYELADSGAFADNRYFDVEIEYAKAAQNDILIRLHAINRGPERATCHLLPTLWFRNTWSWGYPEGPMHDVNGRPEISRGRDGAAYRLAQTWHPTLGEYQLYAAGAPELLFTENETNFQRLFGSLNRTPYVKDAFHRYVITGNADAVNPRQIGTKVAAHYRLEIDAGATATIQLRLTDQSDTEPFAGFDATLQQRQEEADEFYAVIQNRQLHADDRQIQRQALAGMLWSKQLYYYDIEQWLRGDPAGPPPPSSRKQGRNTGWEHLTNFDIISMPDKWEYPWYATWDLAFHCIPLALVDVDFAKRQLQVIAREWYMHPNGAFPAYEWAFGDANPPVHAWAVWRVYKIEARRDGKPDRAFLEEMFHKLLINFTWWVNRKDEDDRNIFQGGFLGLDNISIFDRSAALPTGGHIDQSDGTGWMAFYSLIMLKIALELAVEEPIYQGTATKFFEHFLRISHAISQRGSSEHDLWDERDEFFYDSLHIPGQRPVPLRVRSLVGLLPLIAVETLEPEMLYDFPDFRRRMDWFLQHRSHLAVNMASTETPGVGERHLVAILTRKRLISVLRYLLDETEFLSPYGIRSLSKVHDQQPYSLDVNGTHFSIDYQPAESRNGLFGGNSNWRGPVWFPINYLIIEALQRYHHYYGDSLKVELPTGSGNYATLHEVAHELSQRLIRLFRRDAAGDRPVFGGARLYQDDPHWRDHLLFYEYFHGDNGAGLGASHQTGWTGLVAKLIQQAGAQE